MSSTYVAEYLLLRLALVCSSALLPMELRVTIDRRGDKTDSMFPITRMYERNNQPGCHLH